MTVFQKTIHGLMLDMSDEYNSLKEMQQTEKYQAWIKIVGNKSELKRSMRQLFAERAEKERVSQEASPQYF